MAQPTAHWTAQFAGRIPIAPVFDLRQALENPYVERVGMLQVVDHPAGPQRLLRNPIKLDGQRLEGRACPPVGHDGAALLGEVGYSAAEIDALRAAGAI